MYTSTTLLELGAATPLLTDLPTAKDELGIKAQDTSQDPFVNRAIAQASRGIQSYCNRRFGLQTVLDSIFPERDAYPFQMPGDIAQLKLSHWPAIGTIVPLATGGAVTSGNVLPFSDTSALSIGMPAGGGIVPPASPLPLGALPQLSPIPVGTIIAGITPDASVTLSNPIGFAIPAGAMCWFGMRVTLQSAPGVIQPLVLDSNYLLDAGAGLLTRLDVYTGYPDSWYPVPITVTYQAGYAVIPDDIIDATLRVITDRFRERGRDPRLKSQDQPGIGMQSYWVGSIPGVVGAYPEDVLALLNPYRVPVTA